MAEGGQDLDFMKMLLKTGIIGKLWPSVTYLIVVIKNSNGEVILKQHYQTNNYHTEIQMLDDKKFQDTLKKEKANGRVVDIILTSNYSPCRKCADELKAFYERNESVIRRFLIQFSHPYRTEDKFGRVSGNEKLNRNGLRLLSIAGITLEAMTEESWLDVMITEEWWFDVMMRFLFDLDPGEVRERDNNTRERLGELLSEDLESESSDSEDEDLPDRFGDMRFSSESDSN